MLPKGFVLLAAVVGCQSRSFLEDAVNALVTPEKGFTEVLMQNFEVDEIEAAQAAYLEAKLRIERRAAAQSRKKRGVMSFPMSVYEEAIKVLLGQGAEEGE
jgi:hypothetical protein